MKKTKEHLEAEISLRAKPGDQLKMAKRELTKQRRYRVRRIIQGMQKVKNNQATCQALYGEKEGENTSDRQKWKEELERYSSNKYQVEEMRMKARKELDEWVERCRRQRERTGGRLTMSVVKQSRASFSYRKAAGIDGISAEILQSIPWRALQKISKAFKMWFIGRNNEGIETWLRNIIILIPKKTTIDRLEGQTRGICAQSVLAKWYCGCLTILLEMELRNVEKRDELGRHPYFWLRRGQKCD